jgi:Holliday junction resolvase
MRAKKVDDNQKEIVRQLRQLGVSVQHLHTVGDGCPDLLLGHKGKNFLVELKDARKIPSKKKLTPDEETFFNEWRGQVSKCETLEEILKVIGL